jgi:aspartate-semialdehyde dehydrogenase
LENPDGIKYKASIERSQFIDGTLMNNWRISSLQKNLKMTEDLATPEKSSRPKIKAFIQRVFMTSMQAISGAGRSPGVVALDILDNIIPYIPKEEEKVQLETKKILGGFSENVISPAGIKVSCTCTRVPVLDGHTEAVFVETREPVEPEIIKKSMLDYSESVTTRNLPMAPKDYIIVHDDPTRPQPRIDREINDGMTTVVGRLRKDTAFNNGIKYVLLSHNEKMGSAKGAVLLAELLRSKKII